MHTYVHVRTYLHACVLLCVKQILRLWIPEVPMEAKESNQTLLQSVSSPEDLISHTHPLCVCVYCMHARMNMCVSIHVQVHSCKMQINTCHSAEIGVRRHSQCVLHISPGLRQGLLLFTTVHAVLAREPLRSPLSLPPSCHRSARITGACYCIWLLY